MFSSSQFAPQSFVRTHPSALTGSFSDLEATGDLEIQLAQTEEHVSAAQALRYEVFIEEMGAHASPQMRRLKRDWDEFDAVCDHLIVLDKSRTAQGKNPVVGTYRLLRGKVAQYFGKFYSQSEFDITPIKSLPYEVVELGRSCVHPDYRNRSTMQLLWRGLGAYIMHYNIGLMFGCASFHGTEIEPLKAPLSYLYHYHRAQEDICVRAPEETHVRMDYLSAEMANNPRIIAAMPPLIKGYLRAGACVGESAVKDYEFNTTDVFIMVKTESIAGAYFNKYAADNKELVNA